MVERDNVGPGMFETDFGPEGYVPLVSLDRFGDVEMTATVAAGFYAWLLEQGHTATMSEWVKAYDLATHGTPAAPLTLIA